VSIRHAKNSVGKKGSWLTEPQSGETTDQGGRTTKKRCKRFNILMSCALDSVADPRMSLSPGLNFASEENCLRNELQNLERLQSSLKGSKNVPEQLIEQSDQ
jgi:hypothetical protein